MNVSPACAQYCIQVIRAVMQDLPVPPMPDDVSPEALYTFSKLHGVECLVHHGLCQLEQRLPEALQADWDHRVDRLMTQSIVQLAERDILLAALSDAEIPTLPIKGCLLKEQYPQIHFRQMADLDILIHREDAVRSAAVLAELGYQDSGETAPYHDSFRKPPYTEVERHFDLLPPEDPHRYYFRNIWDRALPDEDLPHCFRMREEDAYIYYILHLHKHVMYAGTGIRSFLDSVVYRKINPDLDRDYLQQEFAKLGISTFVQQVETISSCWFDTGESIPETLCEMAGLVLSAGAYGTEERWLRNNIKQQRSKYKSPLVFTLVYAFSRIFCPLEEMIWSYPILARYSALLPLYWLLRLVKKCLLSPKIILGKIKLLSGGGNQNDPY